MEKIYVKSLDDIAKFMYYELVDNNCEVLFVGLYDDAIAVVRSLCSFEDVELFDIEIAPPVIDDYYKEYYVSLDNDFKLWCIPAYFVDEEAYFYDETDIVCIADDCDKSILDEICFDEAYEISYSDSVKQLEIEKCSGDCEHCEFAEHINEETEKLETTDHSTNEYTNLSRTKDGKLAGFTKSWSTTDEDGVSHYSSFSHYGNNEEVVKKIARDFGIKLD